MIYMAKIDLKKNKKQVVVYLVLFVLMLILSRAKIVGIINPFLFSFLFALFYLGKNVFILSLEYFACYILFDFSFKGLIISLTTISFLVLLFLIFKLLKKKPNFVFTIVFALLSQAGFVYFNIFSTSQILATIVCLLVGLMFLYICEQSFGAIFFRGLQSRFTLDESICFAIFIIALLGVICTSF